MSSEIGCHSQVMPVECNDPTCRGLRAGDSELTERVRVSGGEESFLETHASSI